MSHPGPAVQTRSGVASAATAVSDETLRIRPPTAAIELDLPELWRYRELLLFLVWRDLKVRYKQTVLGVAWAIIPPVCRVALFTVIFGNFAKLPSDGVPYALFAYAALLPWSLLASAVNRSGASLVQSAGLISKVYFPRLVVPCSAVLGAILDYLISLLLMFVLMAYYGVAPTWHLLTLPIWTLLVLVLGLGIGLGLSAANVRYRDVTFLMGFLLEIWMYASPVVYSASIVPQQHRWLYSLNPMAGTIEGFRWAFLGTQPTPGIAILPAFLVTIGVFVAGAVYFTRVERSFADII